MKHKNVINWYVRNTITNKHVSEIVDKKIIIKGKGSKEVMIFSNKERAKDIRKELNTFYNSKELLDRGWIISNSFYR